LGVVAIAQVIAMEMAYSTAMLLRHFAMGLEVLLVAIVLYRHFWRLAALPAIVPALASQPDLLTPDNPDVPDDDPDGGGDGP
jgi:hypothetical protein